MEKIRIVIVEDDPNNVEIQRRFLERIDRVELVGIAQTLKDAESVIEVFNPDLVLLDVHLPDGNGLSQLRKWRAENKQIDVILVTAAKEVETLRSALHSGVFAYILKPLVFERLEESIIKFQAQMSRLNSLDMVHQAHVDEIIHATENNKTAARVRTPKGIDFLTLEKVNHLLKEQDGLTAEEVGKYIGASRTTARRYLEYLASENEIYAEVNYGQVGRPERRYFCKKTLKG